MPLYLTTSICRQEYLQEGLFDKNKTNRDIDNFGHELLNVHCVLIPHGGFSQIRSHIDEVEPILGIHAELGNLSVPKTGPAHVPKAVHSYRVGVGEGSCPPPQQARP